MIDKQRGMEVVGKAEDGRTTVRLASRLMPEVIIMDTTLPDLNCIQTTRQIVAKAPDVKVIALSTYSDKRFVARILDAGASGYLLKDCTFKELVDAVRSVVTNKIYLGSGIASLEVKDALLHRSTRSLSSYSYSLLTVREREVLELLAEGKGTKQISEYLYRSVKTIESHRRNIMRKLNIYTIAGLTKYAIREGITSLET
jgi:DNA-binding NarL/FixJ family response regulator